MSCQFFEPHPPIMMISYFFWRETSPEILVVIYSVNSNLPKVSVNYMSIPWGVLDLRNFLGRILKVGQSFFFWNGNISISSLLLIPRVSRDWYKPCSFSRGRATGSQKMQNGPCHQSVFLHLNLCPETDIIPIS